MCIINGIFYSTFYCTKSSLPSFSLQKSRPFKNSWIVSTGVYYLLTILFLIYSFICATFNIQTLQVKITLTVLIIQIENTLIVRLKQLSDRRLKRKLFAVSKLSFRPQMLIEFERKFVTSYRFFHFFLTSFAWLYSYRSTIHFTSKFYPIIQSGCCLCLLNPFKCLRLSFIIPIV